MQKAARDDAAQSKDMVGGWYHSGGPHNKCKGIGFLRCVAPLAIELRELCLKFTQRCVAPPSRHSQDISAVFGTTRMAEKLGIQGLSVDKRVGPHAVTLCLAVRR